MLGHVGDEPVLADHDDDVVRGEQEPVEVGAPDAALPPVESDRGADQSEGPLLGVVLGLELAEVAAPRGQEEGRLAAGAVLGQQLLQLGWDV